MTRSAATTTASPTPGPRARPDPQEAALLQSLQSLRAELLDHAQHYAPLLQPVHPQHRAGAHNLVHYLAMRQADRRALQEQLAERGLSSLGRAETHVLANLDRVLGLLLRLTGQPPAAADPPPPVELAEGRARLAAHAAALLGPAPAQRDVRIMVTLPSEAAEQPGLVADLVAAGMDVARINCAHDGPAQWTAMADAVRAAAHAAGRPVRLLMDLAGPKLRTGPIASGHAVARLRPERDAFGRVMAPLRFGLRPLASSAPVGDAPVAFGVDARWLAAVADGDALELTDARGAERRLQLLSRHAGGLVVACSHTLYLTPQTVLRCRSAQGRPRETLLGQVPQRPGTIWLAPGDRLRLVDRGMGHAALPSFEDGDGDAPRPATIACTLPQALAQVQPGQRVWFDDGRIGGVVREAGARGLEIDITDTRPGGDRLAADKGINLPDTDLALPALTDKDLQDLPLVARLADIVGLSFAQSAADVQALRARLAALGAPERAILLKIETRRGFEALPELLLAAMGGPVAGVMIARGDLAVECGHERLSEVQEEMLWLCEAAHLPVVWATQVLETLAKTGRPSRAEITDAAMGGRAECVMLNKGPHILAAMRSLDDILCRMQQHQAKKRALLRALRSWPAPAH